MKKKIGPKKQTNKNDKEEEEEGKRGADNADEGWKRKKWQSSTAATTLTDNTRAYVVIGDITRVHYLSLFLSLVFAPLSNSSMLLFMYYYYQFY